MRRLSISLDIAFGKDEEPQEAGQMGSADTITERRQSDEATETRAVGFGRPQVRED